MDSSVSWGFYYDFDGELQNVPLWTTELLGLVWMRLRSVAVVVLLDLVPTYNHCIHIICGYSGKLWTVVFLECLLAHAELHKQIWSTDICNVTECHSPLLLKEDFKPNNSFKYFATFYCHNHNFFLEKKASPLPQEVITLLNMSHFQYLICISSIKTSKLSSK